MFEDKIMKNFMLLYWPFWYIVIFWFLFSSPYFLKGLVPYPSTYQVNNFPPWSHFPEYPNIVKNAAMPDIIGQIYPWKHFTIEQWKKGQIPLWNPYNFAGNPHLANFQSAIFSPLNILYFVISFKDAWSIGILLQPLLAGLFTYLFLRLIKISKIGSLIGSVTFMFCGFNVVWMGYGTLSYAVILLPLALFSIELFYQRRNLFPLFLLSITISFSFFSGHFQTSLYFLLFVLFYVLFKSLTVKNVKLTMSVLAFIILGLLLTMPQLLPSIEFYQYSVRSEIFNNGGGIPISYLITMIAPDFYGNPVTRNDWVGQYAEWASFIGVIPLFLGLLSLLKRNKQALFFFIAAAVVLLLAIDTPLQGLIGFLKIPVISTSNPSRIIVLFSFSMAILAGFGFQNLVEFIEKKQIKKIIVPFILVCLILLICWVLLLFLKPISDTNLIIAKKNFILPSILLFTTGIICLMWFKFKKLAFAAIIFLLLAASYDGFRFAQKWMPFDPKNLVFPQTKILQKIQKEIGNSRIYGNLGTETVAYYDLQSIEGYDPLYIESFGEFLRAAYKGSYENAERSVAKLSRRGVYTDRVLDLLSVGLYFQPIVDTNQAWAYPVWQDIKRYAKIYQDEHFQLFRNNESLSRSPLFYDYKVVSDRKKLLQQFYNGKFDFRKTLLLEEDPVLNEVSNNEEEKGFAKIINYSPNTIEIIAQTDNPALLFLADNYYPGWKAFVDNTETKIYRTDYTFRSVVVPSGNHIVTFSYNPQSFNLGLLISSLAILIFLPTFLIMKNKNDYRKKPKFGKDIYIG